MSNYAETEKALRAELAKEFPGIQFSFVEGVLLKGSSFDVSIRLTWFDGPTLEKVNAVTYKFGFKKNCYVILGHKYSQHFLTSVVSQICAVLSIPMLEIYGTENDAWVNFYVLEKSKAEHFYDVIHKADGKNQHRIYEAIKEEAEAESEREHARSWHRPVFTGREQALAHLGLSFGSTRDDVVKAFRRKVRDASNGEGGYKVDMDLLVKAKKCALG